MEIGETVVLVSDLDGMPAGKEGMVMRVRDDMLLIGFRSAERLEFVLARSWEVLHGGDSERESRSATRNNVNPMSRWLLVRSETPAMDAITLVCRARGYIARARDMEDGWTS